jgi:hypothetical protein
VTESGSEFAECVSVSATESESESATAARLTPACNHIQIHLDLDLAVDAVSGTALGFD